METGYIAPSNQRFNTWVTEANIKPDRKIICSICNKDVNLFVQIDTTDPFFQNVDKAIFHIYTCKEGHEFTVLSVNNAKELTLSELKDTYSIEKTNSITDKPRTHINILVTDKSKCLDCPVGGPMKIKELAMSPNISSKIGGYNPKRDFILHDKILHNKVKIYNDSDPVILTNQVLASCTCFNTLTGRLVLFLCCTELPCFNDKSISQLKVMECSECSSFNILIFSQKLNIGYSSIILDVEDIFYHILQSEDYMNGVVISVDKKKYDIKAICHLSDFDYKEDKLKYKSVLQLDEKQISTLENSTIRLGTSYSKFKRFIKEYVSEEITLDIVNDKNVIKLYGDSFSLIAAGTILENCLIKQEGENIIIFGNIVENDPLNLKSLSDDQEDLVIKLGAKIGNIEELTIHTQDESK